MAARANVQLIGDKDLARVIDQLKKGSRNRVMRNPMKAAMTVVRKEAKRRVPRQTGALRDAIHSKVSGGRKGGAGGLVGMVGVLHNAERRGKIPNYYAQRIEYGHAYRSGANKRANRQYKKWARAAASLHAGTSRGAAQPFLTSAMMAKKGEAVSKFRSKLQKSLDAEVRRLVRKHHSRGAKK